MPDYAPLQWHPFTITSGKDDATVNFLVAGAVVMMQRMTRRGVLNPKPQNPKPLTCTFV